MNITKRKKKNCKNPDCNVEFLPYSTLQKYCSFSCLKSCESLPYAKRTIISKRSKKLQAKTLEYNKLRAVFLEEKDNLICPVAKFIFKKEKKTTEIHHMAGRTGKLLNYTPYWLAVSRIGHNWIHDNPLEAYEYGFLKHSSTII